MDAIEFVKRYDQFLTEIEEVVKPEYKIIIDRLKDEDPHDLVRPDTWFHTDQEVRGLVWTLFLIEVRKSKADYELPVG